MAQRRVVRDASSSRTALLKGGRGTQFQHCILHMYLSQCQLQWRHALLKTGPCLQFVSISFQQVFTYVLHPSCPRPLRQSWTLRWLSQAFSWDENGDFFVYLAVIVLIRLDYIFHKRSDGMEKFSFCLRIGMQRVRALKGDFCVPPYVMLSGSLINTYLQICDVVHPFRGPPLARESYFQNYCLKHIQKYWRISLTLRLWAKILAPLHFFQVTHNFPQNIFFCHC